MQAASGRYHTRQWARHGGADHMMMAFYDYGPCMTYFESFARAHGIPPLLRKVLRPPAPPCPP